MQTLDAEGEEPDLQPDPPAVPEDAETAVADPGATHSEDMNHPESADTSERVDPTHADSPKEVSHHDDDVDVLNPMEQPTVDGYDDGYDFVGDGHPTLDQDIDDFDGVDDFDLTDMLHKKIAPIATCNH